MILTKIIRVGISPNNISHYNQYFKNLKIGEKIDIESTMLPIGSHQIILSKCDICGSEKDIQYREYIKSFNNGNIFTCNKCKGNKIKKTNLEKYGSEKYYNKEKYKETCLEKYGVENTFQNENIKEKIKKTNLEKYGVEFTSQVQKFKDKSIETNLKKYGFEHHLQNEEILRKQKNTNLERYGSEHPSGNREIRERMVVGMKKFHDNSSHHYYENFIGISGNTIELYCHKCGRNYMTERSFYQSRKQIKIVQCLFCNPIGSNDSSYENELKDFIKEIYDGEILLNDRKILNGEELDIYLSELKLALEFNGLYWHSELYKEKNYHLNKTEECEKLGIKLIHIYEDDWLYKKDIVKSKILGIFKKSNVIKFHECEIKEIIDNELVEDFLEKNYLIGHIEFDIKLGLFYKEELVSLMLFGESSELLMFCSKLNMNIVDGNEELFEYFIENYKPKEIISYVNRSWPFDNLYKKFEYKNKTEPNFYFFKNKKRLINIEGELEKNVSKIYDSGNLKFIWTS